MHELLKTTEPTIQPSPVDERLILPARRAGRELSVLGAAPAPSGPLHWQAPTGNWWVINEFRSDPTAELYGGVVVPREVRVRLEQLLREGFAPDRILLGHELPREYSPGDPIPDLVPAKRSSEVLAPRHSPEMAIEAARQGAAATIGLARSAGKALALVAGAAAAAGLAVARLDPIIVAGVEVEPGVFAWVEVDRWSW